MPRDANGRFTNGPDPDRHQFTTEQRRKGFRRALDNAAKTDAKRYAWLKRMMRKYYGPNWYPKRKEGINGKPAMDP